MKFYEFNQNNSGGKFVVNDKLTHRLIIEADSPKKANKIAKELGCYWNGVEKNMDCSCCGDRWYKADDYNKLTFPKDYGNGIIFNNIAEYCQYLADKYYSNCNPDIRIFYLNGDIKEFSKAIL